jgi:hypothetical protein
MAFARRHRLVGLMLAIRHPLRAGIRPELNGLYGQKGKKERPFEDI